MEVNVTPRTRIDRQEEYNLFAQLHYARHQICQIRRRLLTAAHWRTGDLNALLSCQQKQLKLRNKILLANRGLVITLAKRAKHYGIDCDDLVSEGNMALWRAVERFDYRRGFKLSTYAWRTIGRSFYRLAGQSHRYSRLFPVSWEPDLQQDDPNERRQQEETRDWVEQIRLVIRDNLANLSGMEQSVIKMRFSINQESYGCHTLREIADSFGLSKERIRQIQNAALAKLREITGQLEVAE